MAGTRKVTLRPSEALGKILSALDRLEIPYQIGGSTASSAHGIPRTTLDVDLVVDMPAEMIAEFTGLLGNGFFADAGMIRTAFAVGRAANVIHYATAWKFDLFPLGGDDYSRAGFARRSFREIQIDDGGSLECAVATAEDTILRKLEWYRAGGERSERQWNDLLGVARTMRGRLDTSYLQQWAPHLKVADLLDALLLEAQEPARQDPAQNDPAQNP